MAVMAGDAVGVEGVDLGAPEDLFVYDYRAAARDIKVYVRATDGQVWLPDLVAVRTRWAKIDLYTPANASEKMGGAWFPISDVYFWANEHQNIYERVAPFDGRILEWASQCSWVHVLRASCAYPIACGCLQCDEEDEGDEGEGGL